MLGKLLGRDKANERFPEDSFTIGQGERDGLPAIVMLNLAYRDYPYSSDYPWHLAVEITIGDRTDAGLPTNTEAEVLNAVEDTIEQEVRKSGGIHYIARQTWNGLRLLDYYVENLAGVEEALAALRANGALARSFTYKLEEDPDWALCRPFFKNF